MTLLRAVNKRYYKRLKLIFAVISYTESILSAPKCQLWRSLFFCWFWLSEKNTHRWKNSDCHCRLMRFFLSTASSNYFRFRFVWCQSRSVDHTACMILVSACRGGLHSCPQTVLCTDPASKKKSKRETSCSGIVLWRRVQYERLQLLPKHFLWHSEISCQILLTWNGPDSRTWSSSNLITQPSILCPLSDVLGSLRISSTDFLCSARS